MTMSYFTDGDQLKLKFFFAYPTETAVFDLNGGWFGLGFGNSMTNVDMFMCRMPTGQTTFECRDFWGTTTTYPTLDTEQNIQSTTVKVPGLDYDAWTVEITRPLDTSDEADRVLTPDSKFGLLVFAFGFLNDKGKEQNHGNFGRDYGTWYLANCDNCAWPKIDIAGSTDKVNFADNSLVKEDGTIIAASTSTTATGAAIISLGFAMLFASI